MSFGEKIQKLRKEAGLSQEDLAARLDVSRQAVSKWERDSGYPETEKILRMARLFQVTVDYLLNDEDQSDTGTAPRETGYYVSRETAAGFLSYQRRRLGKLGGGAGLLIGSLSLPIYWSSTGELVCMLVVIAGLLLLFSAKLADDPYRRLRREPLTFDPVVKAELNASYAQWKMVLHVCALAGIALIAFGMLFCPLVDTPFQRLEDLLLSLDMVFVGIGACLCIYAVGLLRTYRRLLQNEEHFLN